MSGIRRGDVAGKSIPAAMSMATFQASLKTLSTAQVALPGIVANMNSTPAPTARADCVSPLHFFRSTMPPAVIFTYINAGHKHPILRRSTGLIERLMSADCLSAFSPRLGMNRKRSRSPRRLVIIFTDGLVEARKRAPGRVRRNPTAGRNRAGAAGTPQEMLTRMMAEVDLFVGTTPQHDDVTCLL